MTRRFDTNYTPAIVQGGFVQDRQSNPVGVAGFPSGFVQKPGAMADAQASSSYSASSYAPTAKNQLSTYLSGNGASKFPNVNPNDPAVVGPLLAIAALHGFGLLPNADGSIGETHNWLAVPLYPPCDPSRNLFELAGYSPPSCIQMFSSSDEGIEYFLKRLSDIQLLNSIISSAGSDRDFNKLAAYIYPMSEISYEDPNEPVSKERFQAFVEKLWIAYTSVMQSIAPSAPLWEKTSFTPAFGNGGDLDSLTSLPSDNVQRFYTAAAMIAKLWPMDVMPLNTPEEGQTAIQAALAIVSNFGNFGLVGQQETNNWLLSGDATSNPNSCSPANKFAYSPTWTRCVILLSKPILGAQALVISLASSTKTKEALLTGDLGKLAYGLMLDGFFTPLARTKEAWTAATKTMGEFLASVVSVTGDVPRWKISDFVPQEFQNVAVPPNPCKPGEDYVGGVCVAQTKPTGIDASELPDEGKSKKSSWLWWVLGGAAVLGGGYAWMRYEEKKKIGEVPSYQPNPTKFMPKDFVNIDRSIRAVLEANGVFATDEFLSRWQWEEQHPGHSTEAILLIPHPSRDVRKFFDPDLGSVGEVNDMKRELHSKKFAADWLPSEDTIAVYKERPEQRDYHKKGADRYGAHMGRASELSYDTHGHLRITQVPLDRGGYDPGGAYWGIGERLYMAESVGNADLGQVRYFRAKDRAAAVRKFPKATFARA